MSFLSVRSLDLVVSALCAHAHSVNYINNTYYITRYSINITHTQTHIHTDKHTHGHTYTQTYVSLCI